MLLFQDLSRYKSSIPHLVTISGRHESAVKKMLAELKSRPIDAEELALLHNIHSVNISGHLGRGFAILGKYPFIDRQPYIILVKSKLFPPLIPTTSTRVILEERTYLGTSNDINQKV